LGLIGIVAGYNQLKLGKRLMGRTYYKRVYVEDDLPSFLLPEPEPSNDRVPEMRHQGTYGVTEKPDSPAYHVPALHADYPNSEAPHLQASEPVIDARFLLHAILLLIGLNIVLFLWYNLGPETERLSMQPDKAAVAREFPSQESHIGRVLQQP